MFCVSSVNGPDQILTRLAAFLETIDQIRPIHALPAMAGPSKSCRTRRPANSLSTRSQRVRIRNRIQKWKMWLLLFCFLESLLVLLYVFFLRHYDRILSKYDSFSHYSGVDEGKWICNLQSYPSKKVTDLFILYSIIQIIIAVMLLNCFNLVTCVSWNLYF
jgi:hypothetical protein